MSKLRRHFGTALMLLGAVLLAGALGLVLYNRWDSDRAGAAAQAVLEQLPVPETVIPITPILHKTLADQPEQIPTMAVETIDGWDYIGTVEIPGVELTMPVMAEWSYEGLEISPCVYAGTYFTGDLVICGHNYDTQFGAIRSLAPGAEVILTTVDGYCYRYQVTNIETLRPQETEAMVEPLDWDLTLFTCHRGGGTRCTIRCTLMP